MYTPAFVDCSKSDCLIVEKQFLSWTATPTRLKTLRSSDTTYESASSPVDEEAKEHWIRVTYNVTALSCDATVLTHAFLHLVKTHRSKVRSCSIPHHAASDAVSKLRIGDVRRRRVIHQA